MNSFGLLGPLVVASTVVAAAQVPVHQEPRHHVTFENAQLRILDVRIPPREATLDHRHELDVVTVSMNSGTATREQKPGQGWGPQREPRALGHAAVTEYTGTPGTHRVENTGMNPYQLFAVENLRTSGWATGAPAKGLGTTLATESRAFRVYDVRLGRDAAQTSHTHAVPTVVVLVSGAALSDGPDTHAKALAPAPVGLKQLTQTGEWILVPAGDTHHVVRLGAGDAHVVEIEVR